MKRLVFAGMLCVSCMVHAAAIVAYVKMPDGKVLKFETASVPSPDRNGYFFFKEKGVSKGVWAHAANVWFERQ